MSISTKTGDGGDTALIGGSRVKKDNLRIEAYGNLDELNACVGLLLSTKPNQQISEELAEISRTLFSLGADLATPNLKQENALFSTSKTEELTSWVHREEKSLPALRNFILPGGCPGGAYAHLARTICRRCERSIVSLQVSIEQSNMTAVSDSESLEFVAAGLAYVNRLSDLLFVYSRRINLEAGAAEIEWHSPKSKK